MKLIVVVLTVLSVVVSSTGEETDYSQFFPTYDNDIRYRACRILKAIGDKSAVPAFVEILGDNDEKLTLMAVDTLIKFQAREAVPNLARLLKDPSPGIRIKALAALSLLGDEKVIGKVLPLMDDVDQRVKDKAKATLKKLGYVFPKKPSPKPKPKPKPKEQFRKKPSETTRPKKRKQEPSVNKLISDLKSGEDGTKIAAMKKLVRLKATSAVPVISSQLSGYSRRVFQEAIRALTAFGDKSCIPYLFKSLEDVDTKTALSIFETAMNMDKETSLPIILREGLKHRNSAVRIAAIRYAAKNRIKQGSEGIIKLLDDGETDVRKSACIALGQLQARQAVPQICALLSDEEETVRTVGISTLGKLGDKAALPYLIERLDEADVKEHVAILESMTAIGEGSSVSYLVDGLGEYEPDVRLASARCLALLIHDDAILPLVEAALVDPETNVRHAAAESLRKYESKAVGEILVGQLDNEDSAIRQKSIQLLGDLSVKSSIPQLKDFFEEADSSEKKLFVEAIGKIKDPSGLEIILRALEENDRYLKQQSIEVLSSIMGKESEPHLVKLLKDDDIRVGFKAAVELAKYGNFSSTEILIWALKDEYVDVRNSAEKALLKLRDKSTIPELASILKDEHYRFRYFATVSLSDKCGKEAAVPQLVKELESADPWIRYTALKVLYHFKDSSAKDALRPILESGDCLSRIMAVRILGVIAEESSDAEVIESLGLALEDKNPEVRCVGTEALAKIKDAKVKSLLIKMLEDPESPVRYAAAFSLAQQGESKTIPVLCEALRNEDVEIRYKAAKAFYHTCSKEAVPFLEEALDDKSPIVKDAASSALEKWGFQ